MQPRSSPSSVNVTNAPARRSGSGSPGECLVQGRRRAARRPRRPRRSAPGRAGAPARRAGPGPAADRRRCPAPRSAVAPGVGGPAGRAMTTASEDDRIVRRVARPDRAEMPPDGSRRHWSGRPNGARLRAIDMSLLDRSRADVVPTILADDLSPTAASGAASAPTAASSGPGRRGICGVRENRDGTLWCLAYGAVAAAGLDPIEKKPLFHVDPGSLAYSIATARLPVPLRASARTGRSPRRRGWASTSRSGACRPAQVVEDGRARRRPLDRLHLRRADRVPGVRARHRAPRAARRACATCSSRTATRRPRRSASSREVLDAANVDLKSFDDAFYRRLCGARLAHVLEAIVAYRDGRHLAGAHDAGHPRAATTTTPSCGRWPAGSSATLGPRHAVAREPVPPGLPDARRAAHAARDPAPGRGDRAGGRPAVRVRRERAGARPRGHAVRRLRPAARGAAGYRSPSRLGRDGACPGCGRARPRAAGRGAGDAGGGGGGAR